MTYMTYMSAFHSNRSTAMQECHVSWLSGVSLQRTAVDSDWNGDQNHACVYDNIGTLFQGFGFGYP